MSYLTPLGRSPALFYLYEPEFVRHGIEPKVRLSESMEYSKMKSFLTIALITMMFANPTLAQNAPTTTTGGGPNVTVQSTNGTGTVKDTTSHTTFSNGVVVSTSTGRDGKPNGGAGSGPKPK